MSPLPAKGMSSRKCNKATVIKAHAVEDFAQVVRALRGVWKTSILRAWIWICCLVSAAWPPGDVRTCSIMTLSTFTGSCACEPEGCSPGEARLFWMILTAENYP